MRRGRWRGGARRRGRDPPGSRRRRRWRTPTRCATCEYWLNDYGFSTAWQTTKGAGVKIAVIDTGVDGSVPDLAGAVVGGTDVSGVGSPNGQQPLGDGDSANHGTWVASLLAGRGTGGSDGVIGVAPEATILTVSIALRRGRGTISSDDQIADAVRWAVDNGAEVINMSLTRNTLDWPTSWDDAFLYAIAARRHRGGRRGQPGQRHDRGRRAGHDPRRAHGRGRRPRRDRRASTRRRRASRSASRRRARTSSARTPAAATCSGRVPAGRRRSWRGSSRSCVPRILNWMPRTSSTASSPPPTVGEHRCRPDLRQRADRRGRRRRQCRAARDGEPDGRPDGLDSHPPPRGRRRRRPPPAPRPVPTSTPLPGRRSAP